MVDIKPVLRLVSTPPSSSCRVCVHVIVIYESTCPFECRIELAVCSIFISFLVFMFPFLFLSVPGRVTLKRCCLSLWPVSPPSISVWTSSQNCWPSPSWKSRWTLPTPLLNFLALNLGLSFGVCQSHCYDIMFFKAHVNVHTDLCCPVAVTLVYAVCLTQILECGQVGHQCHGDPSHRWLNWFLFGSRSNSVFIVCVSM